MSTAETKTTTSVSGWKKVRDHTVVCPSGATVVVRIPDLAKMIELGEVPQHLLDAAMGVAGGDAKAAKPSLDLIKQEREFTNLVVGATVVEPKLKETDIDDIPFEDKEFIVALAMRQRDVDAVGDHLGGLHKSEKFRRFRGIGEFDTTLEDA